MSESLFFLANRSFAHFFAKNKWFPEKADEGIPRPVWVLLINLNPDSLGFAHPYSDPDGPRIAHPYLDCDGLGFAHPYSDPDGLGFAHPYSDPDSLGFTDPCSDLDCPGFTHPYLDADSPGFADPYSHPDCLGFTHPYSDPDSPGFTDPYFYVQAWTLNTLMGFYVFFPIALVTAKRLRYTLVTIQHITMDYCRKYMHAWITW